MEINSIIGLDLSITSTGMVEFDLPFRNNKPHVMVIKTLPSATMTERLKYISDRILDMGACTLVFMEGYSYGSFNTEVLAQLGGIIKLGVYEKTGIAPIVVSPNTLKKFVLGAGKGQGKEAIKLGAYKRWGIEYKTSDETDAYALARLGLQVIGEDNCLYEYEKECIKALTISKKGKVNKKSGKKGEDKPNPNTIELERAGVKSLDYTLCIKNTRVKRKTV